SRPRTAVAPCSVRRTLPKSPLGRVPDGSALPKPRSRSPREAALACSAGLTPFFAAPAYATSHAVTRRRRPGPAHGRHCSTVRSRCDEATTTRVTARQAAAAAVGGNDRARDAASSVTADTKATHLSPSLHGDWW